MNIVQINATYKIGSTGKIVSDLDDVISKNGNNSFVLCGYSNVNKSNVFSMEKLPTSIAIKKNLIISRILGKMGYRNKLTTKVAIKWIKKLKPDIIHLHNIHGDWINVRQLFEYISKYNIPVIWTLHDCWAFTGRCSYFENCSCEKWKTGCYACENKSVYPITYFFDFSKQMWKDKEKWFRSIDNMTIVTPSKWLSQYVNQSYLNKYNTYVINNGIDLSIFRTSIHRSKYIPKGNKKIILGVAASWTERKGLNDIYKLNELIDKEKYQIIVVGLNKRQLKEIPEGIIGIGRTENAQELVELYSSAYVLVNPTYLDNYPTVNLEAIACGTPVITYNTGGSPESITSKNGFIVPKGNITEIARLIREYDFSVLSRKEIIRQAKNICDKEERYKEYIQLYLRIARNQ